MKAELHLSAPLVLLNLFISVFIRVVAYPLRQLPDVRRPWQG